MKKLTKKEKSELIGGVASSSSLNATNTNSVANCSCTFNDTGVTINDNKVTDCSCTCAVFIHSGF